MDIKQLKALKRAVIARAGVTTGAGAATGDSFIDAGLIGVGAGSFISMLAVVYPGQPDNVDSMDITAFNNATGEVTLAKAYKGVAAAIPINVPYMIVTSRFTPAEVAALTALVVALGGTPTEATYALPNDVVENTAFTILASSPLSNRVFIILDLSNLVQNADIRIRYDMHGDGAPFPVMETFNWTVGMDDIVYFREISGQRAVQVTVQSAIAQGAIVDIDYEYVLG